MLPVDPVPHPDQSTHPATGAGTPDTGRGRASAEAGAPVEQLAEFGGDSACWLARVCPDCGRITEGRDPDRCSSCGQVLGTA